ncbi:MAG: hypothetical protein JXA69_18095, partial [Phycisphaerae bacterium]|nr:hypothetical protein [Phycisphaerae bacterium]
MIVANRSEHPLPTRESQAEQPKTAHHQHLRARRCARRGRVRWSRIRRRLANVADAVTVTVRLVGVNPHFSPRGRIQGWRDLIAGVMAAFGRRDV